MTGGKTQSISHKHNSGRDDLARHTSPGGLRLTMAAGVVVVPQRDGLRINIVSNLVVFGLSESHGDVAPWVEDSAHDNDDEHRQGIEDVEATESRSAWLASFGRDSQQLV
jgi:hypothetical protein